MLELFSQPEIWIALLTLTSIEIVLGIDNIIFISVIVSRLPVEQRNFARKLGIGLAMVSRLALLLGIFWVMGLVDPLFKVYQQEISGRDIILIVGGLFLLVKSTHEIHNNLADASQPEPAIKVLGFASAILQIVMLDIVFSLDSVITAVGLVKEVVIIVIAIIVATAVMLFASKPISKFIDANPSIKILALAFLILIGVTLIAEGLDSHINKGYIYFAMAFSFTVEMINITLRKRQTK